MKAQAVEEHLFAEDVHFFNSDKQGGHAGPNDRAGQRSNSPKKKSQLGLRTVIIYLSIILHMLQEAKVTS